MGTVSVSLPSDGTTADVADYNTPITTIVNAINGNLDNTNVATGAAISTSKLADDAGVTTAKIANNAVDYTKVAAGAVVQVVSTNYDAVATGTADIPADDTIPQIGEGDQYMSQAITPKSATNILIIEVTAHLSRAAANGRIIGALFQDSTANAIAANDMYIGAAGSNNILTLRYKMTAGTTSSTTFTFRAGEETAGGSTLTFNGWGGARKFGAIPKSNITVWEIKA